MAILMVFVLNREEYLDEVLAGFVEIGIGGATIIDSMGMGRILTQDIPIFAGLQGMLSGGRPHNKTVLSVLPDRKTFEAAAELIEDVCGNLETEGVGILFALDLADVRGLKPAPE
jgi:nitrogen regulatory protein P-II 1